MTEGTELPGWAVGAGAVLVSLVIGMVGFLLKRSVSALDAQIGQLAAQIGALQAKLDHRSEQTGAHAVTLGVLTSQLDSLERRLEKLEDAAP